MRKIFICMLFAIPAAEAEVMYRVVDLGVLTGPSSSAYAINNSNMVVGNADASYQHAFLWNGEMRDLGTLPGDRDSYARGINNFGQVVGWSFNSNYVSRPFLYDGERMRDLSLYCPPNCGAFAINDAGVVLGTRFGPVGDSRSFVLNGTSYQEFSGNYEAIAINNRGEIVGGYLGSHAFLSDSSGIHDLGTGFASDINDNGVIVGGTTRYSSDRHAVIWNGANRIDIEQEHWWNTIALSINNSGAVVGWGSYYGSSGPFLYQNGSLLVLQDLLLQDDSTSEKWYVNVPEANMSINDSGIISTTARRGGGYPHAVLLVPTPEPNSLSLLLLGAAFMRRRRR